MTSVLDMKSFDVMNDSEQKCPYCTVMRSIKLLLNTNVTTLSLICISIVNKNAPLDSSSRCKHFRIHLRCVSSSMEKMLFIPSLKLTSNVRTRIRDRHPIVTQTLIVAVKRLNKLLGVFILQFHNFIVGPERSLGPWHFMGAHCNYWWQTLRY